MLYVILLYALFASVFTIAKTGLEYSQPFFLVGTRMLLAGCILLGYQKFVKKEVFSFNRQTWWKILQLAAFNIYLTNVFEFWGLKYLTSFKTCFIYSLSPFLSALFCYMLFSEKLSPKKWMGLLIGFMGFLPILMSHTSSEEQTGHLLFFSWAELSVMMAAICSVYGWIVLMQLVNQHKLSPVTANGTSMFVGGAFALVHSLIVEDWNPIPVTNVTIFLECTLLLILISNLICYNLYGTLLKRYSATFISFAGFTTPLFTALFGWIFLGEVVTWPFYVSFVIVLAGLFVFDQDELKQSYQDKLLASKPSEA
ncbi:DMT family transporter [Candidatus Protochlamydia phocaeensis]|uniref:DMT family transporter n=1 Tax=Candidatus Protochlamydia phocaeensis TaxID=1414722 RepID=UPI00083888E8|nr:DMT family transporter [Candidatus Protochlamydia phocaeensis]